MARPKQGQLTQKAAVEAFLGKGLSNQEIINQVKKAYDLVVTSNYISIIKGQRKKSEPRQRPHFFVEGLTPNPVDTALRLIEEAGGPEAAHQLIDRIERSVKRPA